MTEKLALVLGATGGIGGEVANRLTTAGWRVRAMHRDPAAGHRDGRFEWVQGDAMNRADVTAAAHGASLVVHAVNPPGYRDWEKLVLPMLDNTIAAASTAGARVLLPGTVYNYGPDAFPDIAEDAAQEPLTKKGRIRVEMERRLQAAAERGAIGALIVRAGDFFGPAAANNWFSQGLVKPGKRPTSIGYPGRPRIGHQWAYLPDVAATMVRLVDRGEPARFERFHMEGHWDADGTRMVAAIQRALGEPAVPVKRTPWLMMRLASPFVPLLRELMEMKYLWEQPVRLRNARLVAVLGAEPRTPLDEAVRETLAAIGCLEPAHRPAASAGGMAAA